MSIRVMTEFFGLRFGSSNRKAIAVRLADFADDSGRGIWPTVERVAEDCELSARTVQRVLEDFVAEGMLIVVKRGGSGPGSTTHYDFDLARVRRRSAEIAAALDPEEAKGDRVSPLAKGDSDVAKGDNGDRKGCHGVTQTLREPLEEPSLERGRGRDGSTDAGAAPAKNGERAFRRAFAAWPTFVGDSEPAARKAWDALTADERLAAAERLADYVASVKGSGRSKFCSFGVYLAERRWQKLPPRQRAVSDYAPPFGPVWGAWRVWHLLTAAPADGATSPEAAWPLVQALHAKARQRQGHRFAERWHLPQLTGLMEAVPVGSDTWTAWERCHGERHWPWLPDPGGMPVVWFPAGGPAGLQGFEQAVRGHEHDARHEAAE